MTCYYAYSQAKERSRGAGYVQERVWEEREDMKVVFEAGARLYVCGSAGVGTGVEGVLKRIYKEAAEARGKDKSEEEIEEWWVGVRSDRYASDVFA